MKLEIEGHGGTVTAHYDQEARSWHYKTPTGSGGAAKSPAEVMYWAGFWDGKRAQSAQVAATLTGCDTGN